MHDSISDFYKLSNISAYENAYLLDLSENCAALEEKLCKIAQTLPPEERQIISAYILARNDLELETFKNALRWGKEHYL